MNQPLTIARHSKAMFIAIISRQHDLNHHSYLTANH